MKKTLHNLAFVAAALVCTTAQVSAQTHDDLFRFSEYNWSYGTARSAAMGGAFSSLGADLSAPMLNPAGLGMYRRSEIGLSLGYTSLKSKTEHMEDGNNGTFTNSDVRDRVGLRNLGAAFNVYNGSGSVTSVTLGLTYNRLIDHNSKFNVGSRSGVSMTAMYTSLMNEYYHGNPLNGGVERQLDARNLTHIWMPMLSWKAGVMDYLGDRFVLDNIEGNNVFVESNQHVQTKGNTGQFDVALGMNFMNKLYFGMGFGFQDISYKEQNRYGENILNNQVEDYYRLDHFDYYEYLKQSGSAWNFKFGAIYRPVEALRISAALHTPTYIDIKETYGGEVSTQFKDKSKNGHSGYYSFTSQYHIRTPMRLILGTSYTFFNTAILSIDYERIWYNWMRMYDDDWNCENGNATEQVKAFYRATNNVRVGLETMFAPNWFGRVGFAYYDSPHRKPRLITDVNDWKKYDGTKMNYSAGLGYRNGNWGVDLAYVYMDSKDAPKYVFDYAEDSLGRTTCYKTDRQRHNVTLTASVRF